MVSGMTTIAKAVRSIQSPPASGVIPQLPPGGGHGRLAPVAQLAQVAVPAAEFKRLALLPGAGHFIDGQLEAMQHALSGWLREQLP
jgi:hypothetical protein